MLRRNVQLPYNPLHHFINENEASQIKCIADISVVALHRIKNTSSGDLDSIRLSVQFNSILHFGERVAKEQNTKYKILEHENKYTVYISIIYHLSSGRLSSRCRLLTSYL